MILDSVAGSGFNDNFLMLNALGHLVWFGNADGLPKANVLLALASNQTRSAAVSVFYLFNIMQRTVLLKNSIAY